MRTTTNVFRTLLLSGLAGAVWGGSALAGPVNNYTASVSVNFSPTVTGSTIGFTGPLFITSASGEFGSQPAGPVGSSSGTIAYSTTVGVTTPDILTDLLTFTDNAGGNYEFSATSALTTNYANTPGVSTTIALYILGDTSDANLGESDTPTSMTLTLNSTGGSAFSASFTLSNPPAPLPPPPPSSVPEPMTLALLGVGLAGLGVVRRRRSRS
jgi:hypothetical protein